MGPGSIIELDRLAGEPVDLLVNDKVVAKGEGFGLKTPFITGIYPVLIRQQARKFEADCYSSDLQQVKISMRVLYRIPEGKVVNLFCKRSLDF